jgi:hypothetical protein
MFRRNHSRRSASRNRPSLVELLESRTLLSETASAQLQLLSTTGTQANPVFNYNVTVTNTGTTPLGTFWFGWLPGEDFLPSVPSSIVNPSGWANSIQGGGNSVDGSSIQWVAQSSGADIAAGQSLSGFDFSSADSPTVLAGFSTQHPGSHAMTSFVYGGAPFSDGGFEFTVAGIPANTAASMTSLQGSASSITQGQSVTLTATVAPMAPGGATPTGSVTFFDGSTSLGNAGLQSNGTAQLAVTSLPVGTDSVTAHYGGDTSYSASDSAAFPVTVNAAPTPPAQPALAASIAKSTLPSSVIAGAPTHGVVNVDVTDNSGSAVKGPVTVDLFASTDGAIDNSSVLVTHLTRTLSLKAGKTLAIPLPVKSLPANLANGNYALFARVIDPSSNAADSAAGPGVTVAAPFIALSETFSKITIPASVAAGSKLHAVASLKISNTGNDTSSGATTIAIDFSADGAFDNTAVKINSATKSLKIKAGKSVVVSVPLTAVLSVAPSDYFVVAQVTDPQQQLSSAASQTKVTVTA